jgi:hypothetical protein
MGDSHNVAVSASTSTSTSTVTRAEQGGGWGFTFTVVRILLGVLLIAAAGLKLFDRSPDPIERMGLLASPHWHMTAIEAEALLDLWLLTGAFPRLLWLAALLCFSLLGGMSLYLGIEGQASCGCFGAKLAVSPWYALGLDLAAVASLVWWRPRQGPRTEVPYSATVRGVLWIAAGSGAVLAVGFAGLSWIYGSPHEALLRLRGESMTVDPWVTDFGDCRRLETRSLSVRLTNQTDHAIQILGGTADCSCILGIRRFLAAQAARFAQFFRVLTIS